VDEGVGEESLISKLLLLLLLLLLWVGVGRVKRVGEEGVVLWLLVVLWDVWEEEWEEDDVCEEVCISFLLSFEEEEEPSEGDGEGEGDERVVVVMVARVRDKLDSDGNTI